MNSDHYFIVAGLIFFIVVLSFIFIVAEREFFSLLPKQYRKRIKGAPEDSYLFFGCYMFFIRTGKSWKSWSSCKFYFNGEFLIIRPSFPFGAIVKSAKIPLEDMCSDGHVIRYFRNREIVRLSKGPIKILIPSIVWRELDSSQYNT